jgi:predicted nucleotidyltransferase
MEKIVTEFVENLKKALGNNLKSFIVYGSAATGEHYVHSDYNTLIVLESNDTAVLKAMTQPVKKWVSMRQPLPMIFTRGDMITSSDVFPMEYLDMKENSVILYGEDILKKMKVGQKNLRLEIERELKSKLIRLRQNYIITGGRPGELKLLLIRSISSFVAILKGILRLYKKKAPSKKHDIIEAAPAQLKLDKQIFFDILAMKDGSKKIDDRAAASVFAGYMKELEKLAGLIDRF